MTDVLRDPARLFARPAVSVERRADGAMLLRSPQRLESYNRCVGEYLEHRAAAAPERPFLLERRADGGWGGVTYGEARGRCDASLRSC